MHFCTQVDLGCSYQSNEVIPLFINSTLVLYNANKSHHILTNQSDKWMRVLQGTGEH